MPALSPSVRAVKGEDGPELWITGEIGVDTVATDVVRAIKFYNDEGQTPVLNIYSHGGGVDDANAFYGYVEQSGIKATVRIWGTAMSATVTYAAAFGREAIEIHPLATIMVHEASGGTDEMREAANNGMVAIYRKLSGLSDSKLRSMMADTTTLTAKEAVAMGFAGRVMKSELRLAAMYDAKPIETKTIAMSEKKKVQVKLTFGKGIAAAFGSDVMADVDVDQAVADQLTEKDAALAERDATIAELKKQIEALEAAKPEDQTPKVEALSKEVEGVKAEVTAKDKEIEELKAQLKAPVTTKTVANNTAAQIAASPNTGKDEKSEFVGQVFAQMTDVQKAQHAAKVKAKKITSN